MKSLEDLHPISRSSTSKRRKPAPSPSASQNPLSTDAERADLFCHRWQHEIAYIPGRNLWLCRDHGDDPNHHPHWHEDLDGGLYRRSYILSQELLAKAEILPVDTPAALQRHRRAIRAARSFGNRGPVESMLGFAKTFKLIHRHASLLNADPFLAATSDGTLLDLRTGQHRPSAPSDLLTQSLGTAFDPAATCPRWDQFLGEVFPDPSVRDYIWKSVGYTLTGDIREQCFFFLDGLGNNGKSTFLKTIESVFGSYALRTGGSLVAGSDRQGLSAHEATRLQGKRLLLASGIEEGQRLNTGALKSLTGGDSLDTADNVGASPAATGSSFRPGCKLWFAGNHRPPVRDSSASIWRRLRLIPMDQFIEKTQRDKTLDLTLQKELPGILNWLLAGCLAWQKEGLPKSDAVEAALDTYLDEEDPLGSFLQEAVLFTQGAVSPHAEIHACYKTWCHDRGIKNPLSGRDLSKSLRALRFKEAPRTNRSHLNWQNLQIAYHRPDGTTLLPQQNHLLIND